MSSQASDPGASTVPTVPAEATTRTMDPPQATSLVVGTIIGVGIFTVPASLASHGPPPGPPPPVDAVSAASVGG